MILKGKLYAEAPIYRGNARKTLFTRDGDGTHRLLSLAGQIEGTAQALMDAFIGQSKNKKNIGLLNQLWKRLYGSAMPGNLIESVSCKLQEKSYPGNKFFDMRMGLRLDEDRWAAEANANYKMETVLRHSVFDFVMSVKEPALKKNENDARLFYLLEELKAGRFWFGAGKSKGMGRLRLEISLPYQAPDKPPELSAGANHLQIDMNFDAQNPILVGWNWGKIDPQTSSFASIEGRLMIEAMKDIPEDIRKRMSLALGGPILSPEDWKQKLADHLPRILAIWLKEQASEETQVWVLPAAGVTRLSKGKHAITKKLLNKIKALSDKPFASPEEAEEAFKEALGKKANMAKRVMKELEEQAQSGQGFDPSAWNQIADPLGMDKSLAPLLAEKADDESAMVDILAPACKKILPRLYDQIDQQIRLLQSDAWVDAEIQVREEHLQIKTMLMNGKIKEYQWNDPGMVPEGVRSSTWREFLKAHSRVRFRHMLNPPNLKKSIANDKNHIEFLNTYREQTRQELSQPHHIDFRRGGTLNREVSRKYGKPYDTIFMRMLCWKPSSKEQGTWEAYIPGSTIKGAFRKRAAMVLGTLWSGRKTAYVMTRLFGAQGKRGMVFFSDAYLADPADSDNAWCSADGIKMNPRTGQPIETSKRDYLYAYGDDLLFKFRMDIQDVEEKDIEVLSFLFFMIQDFQRGDIPLGGEKANGYGWTQARVSGLKWLTAPAGGITHKLFRKADMTSGGLWQQMELEAEAAEDAVRPLNPIEPDQKVGAPPTAKPGFISHRSFGGYCGTLVVEAEALTPMNIQESGEPSFTTNLEEGPVNGWDFFSLSPPAADQRDENRIYALPSRSIKGMLRHIYTIATDSQGESKDIGKLNPAESLFGWVGTGPNQAIMGRVSISVGKFEVLEQEPAWFKAPYPYGDWHYVSGKWKKVAGKFAQKTRVADTWRLFPHAPLAPVVEQIEDFKPDTFQARYFRAILPGERARFTIRFWNLLKEELEQLVWCVGLEADLAHKMGNNRYLGFGSLRLNILEESFLIDWDKRYSGKDNWRLPFKAAKFVNPKVIKHYNELKSALKFEG